MKPSNEVYNYLLWGNHNYELDKITIGYEDRFEGILEISFKDFKDLDPDYTCIPWHRVYYFAILIDNQQIMLWDRRSKYSVFEK